MPEMNSMNSTNSTGHNLRSVSPKKRSVALLLCVFGGIFGLHQFYAGNSNKGVLYLRTAGLCCFGWLADIVWIAAGVFKDSNEMRIVKWW